jgi:putative ABC transport system permease protein
MKVAALAWRNLRRNRRRSLTTLLAMIIGSVSILLFGGYVRNIVYGMQTGYVRGGGHLQIQNRDYLMFGSADPTAYGIADYRHVIDVVRADPVLMPMLTVVTPTLAFGGIAGNFSAGLSRTVVAEGVVVDDQNAMQNWNDYRFPGQSSPMALTGSEGDAAVIGTGVARVLHLCAALQVRDCPQPGLKPAPSGGIGDAGGSGGDALPRDVARLADNEAPASAQGLIAAGVGMELLAATAAGRPNVARLKVVQAETQGVKEFDDIFVALHLDQAQRLLYGRDTPQVTSIELQLRHTDQIPAATSRLQQLLASAFHDLPLTVYDFRTLNPSYGQTIGLFGAIFSFIAILIGAIVLFTVGNTMSAAVVERTVEIGTLRAMGLRRTGIRRLFVVEGLLLGLAGAALGSLTAILFAAAINHMGLTWTPPGHVDPVHLNVRVWGEMHLLVATAVGLTVVTVLSAWWPARRAAAVEIVEALRHV